jgi:hypothetical protein
MKKLFVLVGLIFANINLYSQSLKTYSGNYDINSYEFNLFNPGLLTGTATYTYYEDKDYNRVRQGSFKYTGTNKMANRVQSITYSVNVIGKYKESKKDGLWQVDIKIVSTSGTLSRTFKGVYLNGVANGKWEINSSVTKNGKMATSKQVLNFAENVIIGPFEYTDGNYKINGSLNKEGHFNGNTLVLDKDDEYRFEFKNGLLIDFVSRHLPSGRIYDRFKAEAKNIETFDKLRTEKDTTVLNNIPYTIEYDQNSGAKFLINRILISKFTKEYTNAGLFDAFPGDLSIDADKKLNWSGFTILTLEATKPNQ